MPKARKKVTSKKSAAKKPVKKVSKKKTVKGGSSITALSNKVEKIESRIDSVGIP